VAVNLDTRYLGLRLHSPLVAASSPLTLQLDALQRLAAGGAGAVVLGSLFEDRFRDPRSGCLRSADDYCELVRQATGSLGVPVIASINATSIGAWVHHTAGLQQAGAAAIELDLALFAGDPDVNCARIERDYLDVIAAVRMHTDLPLAVKLPPAFTSLPALLLEMARAGADAAVLFRRPYVVDVDLVHRRLLYMAPLSEKGALGPALRWLPLLRGRVGLGLAASGGIHGGADALKAIAAGADVAMVCSALLRHGPGHMAVLDRELRAELQALGCPDLDALRGSAEWPSGTDAALLERIHCQGQCGA
jgi:dihydroorotate dehydrogenase (fumarate)